MPILFAVLGALLVIAGGVFWALTLLSWTVALAVYFVGTCVLLIMVVLIQKPKGGGLAGAFGGAGGGQQAVFGAKAGDMFTLVTVCLFLLFLLLGMGLVYSTRFDDAKLAEVPDAGSTVQPPEDTAPAGADSPAGKTTPAPGLIEPKKPVDDGGATGPQDEKPQTDDSGGSTAESGSDSTATDEEPKSATEGSEDSAKPPKGSNP
ncbi:MAG: preprotein translocase subunit SecG [Phycisphaeraceae bacterium]|nr:preprotein translocase subunit SecG [Phycisphaeraceae bacterium]